MGRPFRQERQTFSLRRWEIGYGISHDAVKGGWAEIRHDPRRMGRVPHIVKIVRPLGELRHGASPILTDWTHSNFRGKITVNCKTGIVLLTRNPNLGENSGLGGEDPFIEFHFAVIRRPERIVAEGGCPHADLHLPVPILQKEFYETDKHRRARLRPGEMSQMRKQEDPSEGGAFLGCYFEEELTASPPRDTRVELEICPATAIVLALKAPAPGRHPSPGPA